MNALSRSGLAQTTGQQSPILNPNLSPTARNNISIINNKLDDLSQRLASLEKSVASILKVVNKLAEKKKFMSSIEFPLESLSAVEEMDQKIQNDTQKYVTLLRSTLMPEGIVKNFRRIIGRSIVMDFNYSGTFSKKALSSFQALNEALYEAVRRDGYTFADYIKDVRLAFNKAKNCVYKVNSEINKQNQQTNNEMQIEQVFVNEEELDFTVDLTEPEEPQKKKRKTNKK